MAACARSLSHASLRRLLLLAAAALLLAGCGDDDDGTLHVAAASSLRVVLPRIAEDFEREHPELDVEIRFAGSQVLATQIEEGAGIDLFISANPEQSRRLLDQQLANTATVVTANALVVAVAENSPWQHVEELARDGVRIAAGAPDVPVGALTLVALAELDPSVASAIREHIVSEDSNVSVVLSRLELGEVDAAFVYHSDVAITAGLRALALPPAVPPNEYIAVLVDGADEATEELLAFLLSASAQAIFQAGGFLPATAGVEAR